MVIARLYAPSGPRDNATFLEWTPQGARRSVGDIATAARIPEDLEALFEDAFSVGDPREVDALFDGDGLLALPGGRHARGPEIGTAAAALRAQGAVYVGGTPQVFQSRATALVLAPDGVHVGRRREDGTWRLVIALLTMTTPTT